jgi:hypothetical protein
MIRFLKLGVDPAEADCARVTADVILQSPYSSFELGILHFAL